MSVIGIIGGSGFYTFPEIENSHLKKVDTPYGRVMVECGSIGRHEVCFIARHGKEHKVLPHQINYLANIASLRDLNVQTIIAINAVGGIHAAIAPGTFVIPEQIIDYTSGRDHTFAGREPVEPHIEFAEPFDKTLSDQLENILEKMQQPMHMGGVYGCTQGPRLESRAEIARLERDGCDMVGMTLMPEAALARELSISYATICLAVNWAAGKSSVPISLQDIMAQLQSFNYRIREILHTFCIST